MKKVCIMGGVAALSAALLFCPLKAAASESVDTPEQIYEEIMLGDMELISQLVEAEAGNQSLTGKRLVCDVILNRLRVGGFGGSVENIIFMDNPLQFSTTKNGAWEKAAYNMQASDYVAVSLEFTEGQLNTEVLYFNCGGYVKGTTPLFKEGDHYFSK